MWKCRCDCGNEKIVYGGHLETGHTKSCGCIRPPRINLQDKIFERLTVIDWQGNGKWKCKCACGNEVMVKTSNLTSGNTKSCGCLQKEKSSSFVKDLTGKKFGKLTVIKRAPNNNFNHVCWECKCDCGSITIVDVNNLRRGTTNSCGCLKSKGEMIINNWLQENKIIFKSQYSHNEIILNSGRRPFFDFAIFDKDNHLKYLIEYNGKQHYETTGGWNNKEQLKLTQNRDVQKKEWCKKLNIPLYEIAYNENIEQKLQNIVKENADAPDMEEAESVVEGE